MGDQLTQKFQKWKNQPDCTEMKLDGKVPGFYANWYPILEISENSLITEKTEKFLPILFLEIFKLDFQIPGKILSGFLVQHMFWCLVTPMTPRGVTEITKHQKM